MFSISKEFKFSASHALTHLPESHKCHRNHGHNYKVRVILGASELNHNGFVEDYADLDWFREVINNKYDHRNLNEVLGSGMATTAENLAKHFFDILSESNMPVMKVEVSETDATWAAYIP